MNAHVEKQEKTDLNLNMSLYDINKQVISQLPDLDQNGIVEAKTLISEYAIGNYFMLLCREIIIIPYLLLKMLKQTTQNSQTK